MLGIEDFKSWELFVDEEFIKILYELFVLESITSLLLVVIGFKQQ